MERSLQAEWLDQLSADDPRAVGSRRDLRVLNFWMGNAGIMAQALNSFGAQGRVTRVVELGAGDGHFMIQVARRLGTAWTTRRATLVDRQNAINNQMQHKFEALGWELEFVRADVFDWLQSGAAAGDLVVTNLFAHHFDCAQLAVLLQGIARYAQVFVAVEPQRSLWSLGFSYLVGMLGCNWVTRHDAPASVRAGFRGGELSQLWPSTTDWLLEETCAGPFSHLFVARRQHCGAKLLEAI